MANAHETEWEFETEEEFHEGEVAEGEGIMGTIGNVLGGILGEEELAAHEFESPELAQEFETHEFEHPELAHEFEQHEFENPEAVNEFEEPELAHEFEQHEFEQPEAIHEFEYEMESGEQFFKRIARGIGRFVRRAAPILKRVAKVALPMVTTAIGGPFGAILGKAAGSLLGESQGELELETHELTHELEQHESLHETAHEIAQHEIAYHEALAEMMAESAAHEQHEGEAEAMVGAAVVTVITPRERRALRRILPHLVRGVAILTRILRRRAITRPAVRAVPTIVRQTVRTLRHQAAAGVPITRRLAARATATQIRRVLGNPRLCAAAIAHNVKASRMVKRAGAARAMAR